MKILSLKATKEYRSGSGWNCNIEYYTMGNAKTKLMINTLELSSIEDYMEVIKLLINSQVTEKYDCDNTRTMKVLERMKRDEVTEEITTLQQELKQGQENYNKLWDMYSELKKEQGTK